MNTPMVCTTAAILGLVFAGCASTSSRPSSPSVSDVSGTTWISRETDGTYEYTFIPGGALHYKSPTGFWKNGTWKQEGNSVYMETNQKYAEQRGVITGNEIRGHAWNVNGNRWTWVAKKK